MLKLTTGTPKIRPQRRQAPHAYFFKFPRKVPAGKPFIERLGDGFHIFRGDGTQHSVVQSWDEALRILAKL